MNYHYKTDESHEYVTDERCSIIEILNSPEYQNVSIAQARVEPGITTETHALRDTDEIYYILSGHGVAKMEGTEYTLTKGDALLIPKNKNQSIRNTGNTDLVFLCICAPRFQQMNYLNRE